MARKYARRAAERVAKLDLPNVKVLPGDARLFLARYVPPASLRAVHVYFPDPWWKARHKKRRVFGEPLVADVERTLEAGGDLRVATDVEEYYGVIRALVAEHPAVPGAPPARAPPARARPRLPDELRAQVSDRGTSHLSPVLHALIDRDGGPDDRNALRRSPPCFAVTAGLETISPRSHAPRGNAVRDALRPLRLPRRPGRRGASKTAFPRGAWERDGAAGRWRSARSLLSSGHFGNSEKFRSTGDRYMSSSR